MKKIIVILLILSFSMAFFPVQPCSAGPLNVSRIWALPLLGVSVLGYFGASYFRKGALTKYDEANGLYNDYMAVPQGQPNDVFEKKYEAYQDKLAEAKDLRTYYLLCAGGSVLSLALAVYLFARSPSSSKSMNFGYNVDFKNQRNDLFMKVRF